MYAEDTPRTLYDEMVTLENEVERVGRNIKILAKDSAEATADYEQCKCTELIMLRAEEQSPEFQGKRTDAQREAIYRSKYAGLRLARDLAKADLNSERDLLDALKAKLQGVQSRKGIMMSEIEISSRRT